MENITMDNTVEKLKLFSNRSLTHSTTACRPASFQIGREFRTWLDALKPDVISHVECMQEIQKEIFEGSRNIEFENNEFE